MKNRREILGGGLGLATLSSFNLMSCASGANASGTAAATGLTLDIPAEEDSHDFCFMQWPVNKTVYDDGAFLATVQDKIALIANTISDFEPVRMAAAKEHHASIKAKLSGNVSLIDIPTDDLWARDSGPVFAFKDGKPVVTGFNFNGWGNKQVHGNDGQIAKRAAEMMGLPYMPSTVTGEAGGLEWDGEGTLLALESCWVNNNRNKGKSKSQITAELLEMYGAKSMIWSKGIKGQDITDYHIDSLARFVRPGEVIIQLPEDDPDSDDPWIIEPYEAYDIIAAAGQKMHELPTPLTPRVKSEDFVSSYVNYYIANGAIIGAQFGDKGTDDEAAALLKSLYPGRAIISLNIDPIGEIGGGIHCATQQCPKGVL